MQLVMPSIVNPCHYHAGPRSKKNTCDPRLISRHLHRHGAMGVATMVWQRLGHSDGIQQSNTTYPPGHTTEQYDIPPWPYNRAIQHTPMAIQQTNTPYPPGHTTEKCDISQWAYPNGYTADGRRGMSEWQLPGWQWRLGRVSRTAARRD